MEVKRLSLFAIPIVSITLMIAPYKGAAAEQGVRVSVPDFNVTLNGNKVDNLHREYPLLLYKDITYVPMTWRDSRLLGLETRWSEQEGLVIGEGQVSASYDSSARERPNGKTYTATISEFPITINGKTIRNGEEPYPLLSFRNITYFPLTWRFAHDEFGWNYNWDSELGLSITSDNPHIQTVSLPAGTFMSNNLLFKGYYYFTDLDGKLLNAIYRAPITDPTDRELVYSFSVEQDQAYDMKYVRFQVRDHELWIMYHLGGAIMGHDVYLRVLDDGTATEEYSGKLDFRKTPLGTLIIGRQVPPDGGNLHMEIPDPNHKDKMQTVDVGRSDLIYSWHSGTGYSFAMDHSSSVVGNDLYIMASSFPQTSNNPNRIFRIRLATNESDQLTDFGVTSFQVAGDKLYYIKDADHHLYTSDLNGAHEQKLSDHEVAGWYGEVSGKIYYLNEAGQGKQYLYKENPNGEDERVLKEAVYSVYLAKDKMICMLADGEEYGAKVLDAAGELQYAIADKITNVFADKDAESFLIVTLEDNKVKLVNEKKN